VHVIPVLDLMAGLVVRGVGGRRNEYRPIESLLAADARPGTVARGLAAVGFRAAYVADLDAIGGGEPAWAIYRDVLEAGLEPWIDAGVSSVERATALSQFEVAGGGPAAIVAGLESLSDPDALAELLAIVGPERLIFSLDLKSGRPLTDAPAWQNLTPAQIAVVALRLGVRRMIVLDLAAVGMGGGVGTEPFCRGLRCLDPHLQIIAGGGVRGAADLRSLARAGCDAALVASALHDGRLDAGQCVHADWH
jgi:phosphoribosylformimino-5-aminoimidazole carboxamide ribotide isomerase